MPPVHHINKNDTEYREKRKLAAEAYRKGLWIFNSTEQRWYTPEEFMQSKRILGLELRNCIVQNPILGLKSRIKDVENSLNGLYELFRKVETYYNLEPRREK